VSSDLLHLYKSAVVFQMEEVDGLVLNRENRENPLVQIYSLIVGENYLVDLEGDLVYEAAAVDVDHVERVVLQLVPGVGTH